MPHRPGRVHYHPAMPATLIDGKELSFAVRRQVARRVAEAKRPVRLDAVLAGEGLALLPRWGLADELASGRLEEITLEDAELSCLPGAEASLYLLYDARRARLGQVRALIDHLVEELAEP